MTDVKAKQENKIRLKTTLMYAIIYVFTLCFLNIKKYFFAFKNKIK